MKTLSDKLYHDVFTDAPEAILLIDAADGQVLAANAAASELAGYPAEQLSQRSFLVHFPTEHEMELQGLLAGLCRHGGDVTWQGPLLTAAGERVPVTLTARICGDRADDHVAIFLRDDRLHTRVEDELRGQNDALVRTVAERTADLVRANAELQAAVRAANQIAQEARQAAEAKGRFVATLTHELRTPLNALIGMSDLLLDMELGAEQRETAQIVLESAEGLLGLVNDVLDFAKIEAGKMDLRQKPFQPEAVLDSLRETFASQFAQKKLAYRQELDPMVPAWLIGDEKRLQQVLVNLTSNALKFTTEGSVTVEIHAGEETAEGIELYFNVADTGCGIAPTDQKHLFEAYTQIDNPNQSSVVGTGLGLNISRRLVEMMGGRFRVVSAPQRGSTFGFKLQLPVAATAEPAVAVPAGGTTACEPTSSEPEPSGYSSRRKALHVLLAEDNRVNQTVALGMLRKSGFTGVAVDDGRKALAALADGDFDLVFMDLQMPQLGGLEATREIRAGAAGEENRDIPIIAMTGHATRQDRRACLDAGMNGYVTKPISSDRIMEAIADLAKPPTKQAHQSAPCNLAQLLDQMNGDRELATEILAIFGDDTAERLERITKAVCNYDFNKVSDEAFAIESGAANVFATTLVELARELQKAAGHKEQELAESLVDEITVELARIPRRL